LHLETLFGMKAYAFTSSPSNHHSISHARCHRSGLAPGRPAPGRSENWRLRSGRPGLYIQGVHRFEAIEKTAEAGGKTIEFFPSQKVSSDEPNVKWGHEASDEVIQKVKDKLANHHIVAVNYGVVGGRGRSGVAPDL